MGGGASKTKSQKNLLAQAAVKAAVANEDLARASGASKPEEKPKVEYFIDEDGNTKKRAAGEAPAAAEPPAEEPDRSWMAMEFGKPPYGGLAIADFTAEDDNELSFYDGEQLIVLDDYENGWLLACLMTQSGTMGDIPKAYIKRVELEPVIAVGDYTPLSARGFYAKA